MTLDDSIKSKVEAKGMIRNFGLKVRNLDLLNLF